MKYLDLKQLTVIKQNDYYKYINFGIDEIEDLLTKIYTKAYEKDPEINVLSNLDSPWLVSLSKPFYEITHVNQNYLKTNNYCLNIPHDYNKLNSIVENNPDITIEELLLLSIETENKFYLHNCNDLYYNSRGGMQYISIEEFLNYCNDFNYQSKNPNLLNEIQRLNYKNNELAFRFNQIDRGINHEFKQLQSLYHSLIEDTEELKETMLLSTESKILNIVNIIKYSNTLTSYSDKYNYFKSIIEEFNTYDILALIMREKEIELRYQYHGVCLFNLANEHVKRILLTKVLSIFDLLLNIDVIDINNYRKELLYCKESKDLKFKFYYNPIMSINIDRKITLNLYYQIEQIIELANKFNLFITSLPLTIIKSPYSSIYTHLDDVIFKIKNKENNKFLSLELTTRHVLLYNLESINGLEYYIENVLKIERKLT